jgi:hypothetical protein
METCAMNDRRDSPKLEFKLWPLSILAEGHYAISTMRWPLRLVLVAPAVATNVIAAHYVRWRS